MKRALKLTVGGKEVRLRLTMRGQKELKERFGEDILQTLLGAASDSERLCALLTEALSWEGSGNDLLSGEELYERMVDEGWAGQVRFGGLAFDIGAASGLLTERQADKLKCSMAQAVEHAFDTLGQEAEEGEDPTKAAKG